MKHKYIKPRTEVIAAQLIECIAYSKMDDQSPWFDAKSNNMDAYDDYEDEEDFLRFIRHFE